ncbi:MAG: hypothetical protein R6V57_09485 [Vicinamibacterales bacterium]
MIPMPGAFERALGKRGVIALGYLDKQQVFIVMNSWVEAGPAVGLGCLRSTQEGKSVVEERRANPRSQMWWQMRKDLQTGRITLPADQEPWRRSGLLELDTREAAQAGRAERAVAGKRSVKCV